MRWKLGRHGRQSEVAAVVAAIGGALFLVFNAWDSPVLASVAGPELARADGGGLLPERRLLAQPSDGESSARIDSPVAGQRVSGNLEIRGRATTPDPARFDYYRLYVGRGSAATQLRPLGPPVTTPVENGVLATVDASPINPGEGLIVLRVYAKGGETYEARVVVVVEASPTQVPAFTAPTVVLPTVEPSERPAEAPPVVPAPQLAPVAPPPGPLPSQNAPPPPRSEAPIPQLGPGVSATLTGDPVRPDPVTTDIQLVPPVPTQVPFVVIPNETQP